MQSRLLKAKIRILVRRIGLWETRLNLYKPMKHLCLILSFLFLYSCKQQPPKNESNELRTAVLNRDTLVSTAIQKPHHPESSKPKSIQNQSTEKLKIVECPNLTVWGGLTFKYDKTELKVIAALQNAELGFRKTVYYFNQDEITKIEYEVHQANWGEYETIYGKEEFDPSKMTYSDSKITYTSNDIRTLKSEELKELLQNGQQIQNFLKQI